MSRTVVKMSSIWEVYASVRKHRLANNRGPILFSLLEIRINFLKYGEEKCDVTMWLVGVGPKTDD